MSFCDSWSFQGINKNSCTFVWNTDWNESFTEMFHVLRLESEYNSPLASNETVYPGIGQSLDFELTPAISILPI